MHHYVVAIARRLPPRQQTLLRHIWHLVRGQPNPTPAVNPIAADIEAIAASGLFDAAWYCRTQAPELSPNVDPIQHYLEQGAQAGLNPGPLFDGNWYKARYPEVEACGANPLLHYVQAGRNEHRETRNTGAGSTDPARPTIAASLPTSPPEPGMIAVVVHAFYPELFEQIFPLLRNIPAPIHLLVATPTAEAKEAIEATVARAGLPITLVCRVTPNRGRNFGTFFAAFSREILLHRLVLHLHTKRSLYTGVEQAEWRESLYNGLLGSAPLVRLIIGLFEKDPKLGLFYPEMAKHLPYWAHHWLSNAQAGAALLGKIGITDYPKHGYFDYPVGGMFWARVDAIRPLLEAGLTYADFPEEAGQTDGTLAHALERAIGLVPKALGYGFVEYAHETGVLRNNWSLQNTDQYIHTSLEAFEALAFKSDLVSFDLFDTILTRPALTPDAVLHYVGHKMALEHQGTDNFFFRRKQAENIARQRKNHMGDVNIEEIYAAFEPDEYWTMTLIEKAAATERSTDHATLCLRPGSTELMQSARAHACRVIAVSDTYYTAEDIKAVLDRVGLNGAFDAIYISSAEGARKDRGDLWTRVLEREAVAPDRWLHVGDNEQSDIQAACDRGLRFFHVMNPAHLLEFEGFRRPAEAEAVRWPADLVIGPAMLHIAGSPFRNGRPWRQVMLENTRDAGYVVFGPIIFLFMAWLIRHPALRKVSHLYFLSREGYLLHQIYDVIRKSFPQLGLPSATYFYTSRRSSLAAAQTVRFRPERIVAGPGFRGSMHELLLNRIGLALPPEISLSEWSIQLPEDEDTAIAALKILEPYIVEHTKPEADALTAYARQVGMCGEGMFGVVDIGYSATIQKNLQEVLRRPLVGFYMGAFDKAQEVEEQGGYAFGCLAEGIAPWTSDCPALRHSLLMEALLTAPHGQVLSFTSGELSEPVFKPKPMNDLQLKLLTDLHEGVKDYCRDLLTVYGPEILLTDIELLMPQEFLRMLVKQIIRIPPNLAENLRVEDDYCGNGEIVVSV